MGKFEDVRVYLSAAQLDADRADHYARGFRAGQERMRARIWPFVDMNPAKKVMATTFPIEDPPAPNPPADDAATDRMVEEYESFVRKRIAEWKEERDG